MKETLKVSVIVPVHNAEGSLAHCIDSILSQNYGNIECILIENASIDASKFICTKYAEENVNVIFRPLEKPGVSHARNIGLSLASGDIIGFCDADDFLEENAIRAVVTEFIKTPKIAAVFGGFNLGTTKNNCIYKCYKGLKEQVISIERAMQLTLINDSVMGSVWNKYYRAVFLKGIQFDEGLSMCEDMHFNILALHSIQSQFKVKILNIPLYCYMENPNSVTHDESKFFDENNELRYIAALKKINQDCVLDSKVCSCIKMKICCFAIGFLKEVKPGKDKRKKLVAELNETYSHLIRHLFANDWKMNLKRILYGLEILLLDRE